jgi:hypothetical protein
MNTFSWEFRFIPGQQVIYRPRPSNGAYGWDTDSPVYVVGIQARMMLGNKPYTAYFISKTPLGDTGQLLVGEEDLTA